MFILAIIPSIVLLFYIYKKDRREKEPLRLLIKNFVFGIIIVFPVLLMEDSLEAVFGDLFISGSVAHAAFEGFIVAALSEELFKYIALKMNTWKSKEFNCSFDGIVYAVFVSLGFATFENILYVMDGDIFTALIRMFTAVPGHACDAVIMGYFYSKAKALQFDNQKVLASKNKAKALLFPMLFHGLYDWFLSFEEEAVGEDVVLLGILMWIIVVIIEFIISFMIVHSSSKNDRYFGVWGNLAEVNPDFIMKSGNWICVCSKINHGNFCSACGTKRPFE